MRDRLSWYSTIVVHTRRSLAYTCATSTSIYLYSTGNRCFMGPCSHALILESSVICTCFFGGISFRCMCMSQLPNVHFHHNHCCVNSLGGIIYVCGIFGQKMWRVSQAYITRCPLSDHYVIKPTWGRKLQVIKIINLIAYDNRTKHLYLLSLYWYWEDVHVKGDLFFFERWFFLQYECMSLVIVIIKKCPCCGLVQRNVYCV